MKIQMTLSGAIFLAALAASGCMMQGMHGADHRHGSDDRRAAAESSQHPDAMAGSGRDEARVPERAQGTGSERVHDRRGKGLWILGGVGMGVMMALMIL